MRSASPIGLLALTLGTLGTLGCGTPDPDKFNRALSDAAPLYSASRLEVVAELPYPPGNLGVSRAGRVIFTFHPEAHPTQLKVAELDAAGQAVPFPSSAWQSPRDDGPAWLTPLAVRVDADDRLWILDHGDYGDEAATISAFDLASGELVHRHAFSSEIAPWGSMLNDFVVDAARGFVYIADTGPYTFRPGLVVYHWPTGAAWRALDEHASVQPEDHHHVVQGLFLRAYGFPLQLGVDSIALSADGELLVYGPLSGDKLYALETRHLRERGQSAQLRRASVRVFGPKPTSDGIVMDRAGVVYLGAVEHEGIARLRPEEPRLQLLVRDPERLAWVDGLALTTDESYLYASVSDLHRVLGAAPAQIQAGAPYRIVRWPLAPPVEPEAADSDPPR